MSIVELNTSVQLSDIACDNYSIWVSACASTMLSLLTCLPNGLSNKVSCFTPPKHTQALR